MDKKKQRRENRKDDKRIAISGQSAADLWWTALENCVDHSLLFFIGTRSFWHHRFVSDKFIWWHFEPIECRRMTHFIIETKNKIVYSGARTHKMKQKKMKKSTVEIHVKWKHSHISQCKQSEKNDRDESEKCEICYFVGAQHAPDQTNDKKAMCPHWQVLWLHAIILCFILLFSCSTKNFMQHQQHETIEKWFKQNSDKC